MLWGERRGDGTIVAATDGWSAPVRQPNDLSRSLVALDQDSTLIAVIEMGQASWLVAGIVPGVNRHPLKKIATDQEQLLQVLRRWAKEAETTGRMIKRIAVAYEAGRDGFWLARWLRARGVEAYVIHPSSVPVSREHRRAKTDRLDTELLKRAFLGWLRGEPDHCTMAAIPTLTEEDAKRPGRERESLVGERTRIINRIKGALARLGIREFKPMLRSAPQLLETLRTPEGAALPPNTLAELRRDMARLSFVKQQINEVERARLERLQRVPGEPGNAMVRLLTRVIGVGVETADMLVQEIFSRNLRDRKAVARYAGLTGAPDESGKKRRERGLAKSGNARVRRGMLQLAWGFLVHQPDSVLAKWYRARTADARGVTRKTMIVALARKLLIVLWRLATTGEVPEGLALRAAA
jgi:transposase